MSGAGTIPLLLGAIAGGIAALAIRDLLSASPAAARWLRGALEPLRRVGSEGYSPNEPERRRIGIIGSVVLAALVVVLGGPPPALVLAAIGPAAAGWLIADRMARYRRRVESGLPEIANALADSLASGRSPRGALIDAASGLDGPPGAELRRVAAELEVGVGTAEALAGLRGRVRSSRVDALAAALGAGHLGAGDVAGLLRRFAIAAAERDRVAADARAATAQARLTGLLVVAMPVGACLFAELTRPGFVAAMLDEPVATGLLVASGLLQLLGFAAIRRLGRIEPA